MKSFNIFKLPVAILFAVVISSCEGPLEIEPASEYSDQFLQTSEGIEALVYSAYLNHQYNGGIGTNRIAMEECVTDVYKDYFGILFRSLQPYQDFVWDPSSSNIEGFWRKSYRAIRDANILIEVIPNHQQLTDELKDRYLGEAKFIRATAYRNLYGWFGPVPLVTEENKEELFPARSTASEIEEFVVSELNEAAELLPPTVPDEELGRATKGAALGVLAQFQINIRDWAGAAESAKRVMDLEVYDLLPNYGDIFALDNKTNNELIHVFPNIDNQYNGNNWTRNVLPKGYPTSLTIAGTQVTIPIPFYNTFDPDDERADLILTSYTTTSGQFVDLLDPNVGPAGHDYNHPRSLKYPLDEDSALPDWVGQDIPFVRYADILLIRAEGLVMASESVPTEALNLLNEVRNRAGLDDYTTTDIPDAATFIDKLLDERAWEFYSEGKRREDLIRHDRFIQNALDRGISTAQPKHVLYPIPRSEIDANKSLKQDY